MCSWDVWPRCRWKGTYRFRLPLLHMTSSPLSKWKHHLPQKKLYLMIFDTSVIIYLVERAMYKLFEWIEEFISGRRARIYSNSVQLFHKPCWRSWWLVEQKLWRRRGWQAQAWWLVTFLQSFTHSLDKVLRFGFSTGNKTKAPKSVTTHFIKFDVSETNCKTCKMFWRITLMWTGEAANKPCKE